MICGILVVHRISIHALREEGDSVWIGSGGGTPISIHALREEGDPSCATSCRHGTIFLSTPSARRATGRAVKRMIDRCISIHALREEGDSKCDGQIRI